MGSEENWNRLKDCELPEKHRLCCANGCGFFGSSATLNLCSKCYGDLCTKEEQSASAIAAVEKSLTAAAGAAAEVTSLPPSPSPSPSQDLHFLPSSSSSSVSSSSNSSHLCVVGVLPVPAPQQQESSGKSRCWSCRKRVGLTGFRCRCGSTFCGGHRYPEEHGCTFDFKAAGRDAIARENPVVKADKAQRI